MELNSPAGTTTTPETDTESPPTKTLSFPNGSFHHHHHHHHHSPPVVYKECLKNHAAALGGHALDGCGEFMPAPTATSTDPTSLKCAACSCHRNFHRRGDPEEPPPTHAHAHLIEYHPQNSISPPPISSSYYYPPQMLLALSTGGGLSVKPEKAHQTTNGGRKRYRSKFSQEQKDKMYSFSEKLSWKMHKRDQGLVEEFCNEVGVGKEVFKVWMHNNKHTFGKRDPHLSVNGIHTLGVHHNNNNNTHVAANCSS